MISVKIGESLCWNACVYLIYHIKQGYWSLIRHIIHLSCLMYDVTSICGAFGKWPSLYWCLDHVKIIIFYYFPKDTVTIKRAKTIVKCSENLYFHYFGKSSSIVFMNSLSIFQNCVCLFMKLEFNEFQVTSLC